MFEPHLSFLKPSESPSVVFSLSFFIKFDYYRTLGKVSADLRSELTNKDFEDELKVHIHTIF